MEKYGIISFEKSRLNKLKFTSTSENINFSLVKKFIKKFAVLQ